jgi:hypothetical protein
MEQNKSLFEEWESGVGLGRAWWAFASTQNRNRIRELQRTGQHLGLQLSLEDDLVARISAGELQAFGFEGGSDAGPVLIPQRYFWRKEEIDWEKETIAALGKKFHEVKVQGEREPADEWKREPEPIDPWTIRKESESSDETFPSELGSGLIDHSQKRTVAARQITGGQGNTVASLTTDFPRWGDFRLCPRPDLLHGIDTLILDEASMIGGRQLATLMWSPPRTRDTRFSAVLSRSRRWIGPPCPIASLDTV